MATLVLTVVGGFIGGPVGAAIGASLGQQVDAAIFKPKGREGPRLADLKVQASTYGQQIPQLFGTMRVAGSVIWATDLIERRTKSGGGKGRPSVTEYSYAVSLAVALSSRPIRAIRRIWADGNLLRGSSGTFQERCIFRWHDGGEDQAVDPLIASAIGPGSASAFRGLAYAVFEELELGAFGNRIPSLTFEVEADAGSVDAGMIGNALLGEAGRCAGEWPFVGYAASGDRARDALAPLFEVDGVRLASGAGGWRLVPATRAGAPLALAGFREARRGEVERDAIERQRAPLAALPGSILIAAAGSNDGWRGADCWFVVAADAEPVAIGTVRPAAALGHLAEPLAPGSEYLIDRVHAALVTLANPSMTLESVDDAALLGGANRAMLGTEMLQFGTTQPVGAGVWRLSRLLRGRAGTRCAAVHAAATPFVLLDDSAPMLLPEALAHVAESGTARLQWASRGGTAMTEVAIAAAGAALVPLAPMHGRITPDGTGGVLLGWRRRSRVDNGWRDHVDLPVGEGREAWRISLSPQVAGIGPWERATPDLHIGADIIAVLPPGTSAAICQVGDFAPSSPMLLPVT